METYKNHSITFNSDFFSSLNERWLNSIDIYLLLINIEDLLKNNFIQLSNYSQYKETTKNKIEQNYLYFIVPFSEYGNIIREPYGKTRYYNIKIQSIEKIKVINSVSENEQRRIYFLLENPKYIFIHIRYIESSNNNNNIKNKLCLENININTTPIYIINFNPDSIEEDQENKKLFIIIKSKFSIKELNNLKPYLSISFGNKFVKYEVISDNVLSCYIPPQKKKEVIIDIYFSKESNQFMNKISIYQQKDKKTFRYISKINLDVNKNEKILNTNNDNNNINKEIDKFKIFNYGIREIISRVISLFNYFLSHIKYYINEEQKINDINNISEKNNVDNIDISFIDNNSKIEGGGFYEINVNILLEKIITELIKLNKIELLNYFDDDGYNLLHYLSVLNFSKSLVLLNNHNINFLEKSKDNLTVYEICAGKRNLDSLLTIIEIMENKDNEKEKNWFDMDVYKSALFLFLEKQESDFDDVQILNALLKQIKIKYIIDSTSGKIIDNVNTTNIKKKGEEIFIDGYTRRNVRKIQKAVKSWLKRNKYKSLQKTADTLIEKIKESCEGKIFAKTRLSAIFIQKEIRKWLKEKHKKKNKE